MYLMGIFVNSIPYQGPSLPCHNLMTPQEALDLWIAYEIFFYINAVAAPMK